MPDSNTPVTAPPGRAREILTSPYTAAIVAMFMWALSMVLVRGVRGDVPPIGLSFWRTLLAVVLILPFVIRQLRTDLPVLIAHWPMLLLLGFLLFVGGNASLFVGLQDTTAINASLINSFEPMAIVVVGAILFRDAVTLRQGIGVLISLGGVVTLVCRADLSVLAQLTFNRGDLWILAAISAWAFYAVLMRRAPRGVSHVSVFVALAVFGCLTLLPFYLWETLSGSVMQVNATSITTIAVLAVFSTLLSVLLWNRALHGLGSARAGLFVHLIPAYSIVLATLFLGETLEFFHIAGIVLIGIGIGLATVRTPAAH